jgi:hypothetical protein
MAKSGIDYFPLDVILDEKFDLIEAEYGLTGFGVIVRLLQEIYGKAGYYIEWTTEVALLFARKVGLGGNVVSEIVEASIRRGMFDKEKYDKYHVLTSRGIQKRYFEAVSRRKVLEVDENILLVNVALFCPNVDIRAKNVNIFSENANISKQSKVEESREEKSRVKETNTSSNEDVCPSDAGRSAERAVIDAWNSLGLNPIRSVNQGSERKRILASRIKNDGVPAILEAIENVRRSPFLNGQSKGSFTATFDWFIKPSNFQKVLEGRYNDATQKTSAPSGRRDDTERLEKILAKIAKENEKE